MNTVVCCKPTIEGNAKYASEASENKVVIFFHPALCMCWILSMEHLWDCWPLDEAALHRGPELPRQTQWGEEGSGP